MTENLNLHEQERRVKDAIMKESQKQKPNEENLTRLRGLLDQVRMQLGHVTSESGRQYPPEPQARPSEKKMPVADPSIPLKFRQNDTGAALRIDMSDPK